MEDGQLEKRIRSYGGILFTSALILGTSFIDQQSLQVVLTQQQILMTQQQSLMTQQQSLMTQQQAFETQQDNQEKGLSALNLKLDSIIYGFGLTVGIVALSGNLVQVLKYYDDKRALQKKETEQEQKLSKTGNQTRT